MMPKPSPTPLADIIAAKREIYLANKAGMPSADPCRFYWKIAPRDLEAQVQAAKAFAKVNDWKVSRSGFSLRALAGRQHEPWSGQHACGLFDHMLYFKRHRRPGALVTQPYSGPGLSIIDEAQETADWLGLALHVPPAPKASIHYPGGTVFLVFTNRDHVIKWLPEMERGIPDSRVRRGQRYRIIGRAEAS
jgi:hypothetical protein